MSSVEVLIVFGPLLALVCVMLVCFALQQQKEQQMTFESQEVNEFLARKATEQRDSDLKLIADIMTYVAIGLATLALLETMLNVG